MIDRFDGYKHPTVKIGFAFDERIYSHKKWEWLSAIRAGNRI